MDLKDFLDKNKATVEGFMPDKVKGISTFRIPKEDTIRVYELGMFFWLRGGKHFMEEYKSYEGYSDWKFQRWDDVIRHAKLEADNFIFNQNSQSIYARDFLDCLACLGEDKVKELIKEMEVKAP
jgi:hypothetical protein